jgi:hypothetical protein
VRRYISFVVEASDALQLTSLEVEDVDALSVVDGDTAVVFKIAVIISD